MGFLTVSDIREFAIYMDIVLQTCRNTEGALDGRNIMQTANKLYEDWRHFGDDIYYTISQAQEVE